MCISQFFSQNESLFVTWATHNKKLNILVGIAPLEIKRSESCRQLCRHDVHLASDQWNMSMETDTLRLRGFNTDFSSVISPPIITDNCWHKHIIHHNHLLSYIVYGSFIVSCLSLTRKLEWFRRTNKTCYGRRALDEAITMY